MKAIVKNPKQVELITRNKPVITSDNDVLIQVAMAGLCRTDIYAAQGLIKVKESVILGHEFSGIVVAIGEQVTHIKIGETVSVMPIFGTEVNQKMLGVDLDGAFAEYILVPANYVYLIPPNLSFQEAAYLEPIAASLAVIKAPIHQNQRGLIYGKNRIATLTKRILNLKGFKNIEVYEPQQQNYLPDHTYDFIIETVVTNDGFQEIVNALKYQGILLLKSRAFASVFLPIRTIVQKEIKIFGVYYGDFQEAIDLLSTEKLEVKDLFDITINLTEGIKILSGEIYYNEEKKIFFQP